MISKADHCIDAFVYLFLQVKKAKMQESGEQTLRYVKLNFFLMIYLQFFSTCWLVDECVLGWLLSFWIFASQSLCFEITWFKMEISFQYFVLETNKRWFFLIHSFFYSVICTELMFSVGSCDIWKRHDSKYSSVRCAVYRMGRISRNRGNPRDLVLITKWIWDALIISSTPFRQEAASLHLLLLLPVVCELTSNYITSNILISRILPF